MHEGMVDLIVLLKNMTEKSGFRSAQITRWSGLTFNQALYYILYHQQQ